MNNVVRNYSYRSAAALWGLLPSSEGLIDVSVPGDGGRSRRPGIRLHRSLSLLPAAVTARGGIPATTPARTISDLRRAAASSGERGLVTAHDLRRAIRLRGRGYEVIRLAEKQVREDVQRVADVLAAALRVGADAAGFA